MIIRRSFLALALAGSVLSSSVALAEPQGSHLPVAAKSTPSGQQRPNVLIWMLDDVGFAQLSCFGGLIPTPNIDRVAKMGLRYSNYRTTPICSTSRASLLTGRMPHSVHMGGHAATARPEIGYDAKIPPEAGTIAANLHKVGYTTFALGKWDHLPSAEMAPGGPFSHWPLRQGFDRFYGFLSADADNWHPTLIRDNTSVTNPDDPSYHLDVDLADQAITMINSRYSAAQPQPFFMYWATGTAHAPHHAPADWIARFKGKFDIGWDKAREQILKSQIAQGIIPKGTKLAERPEGLPAWDSLTPVQKRLYARQMEVFAAALAHADHEFGRILAALEASGELDNTMVVITSDNGASAEGAYNGTYSEHTLTAGQPTSLEDNLPFLDKWGGPQTYPHYSFGWAVAGDTPFRYYKQTTHEGGVRVPLIVSWPNGIAARGEWRNAFVHVADVAPTIMSAAKVPFAEIVNDVRQVPMEGQDVSATFADAKAPGHVGAQYFEMYGNKGLYQDGWTIVTSHRFKAWDVTTRTPINEPWELYNVVKDPGQTENLAARMPDKVAELEREWEDQAKRYNIYPLGNIGDSAMAGYARGQREAAQRGGKWHYSGPIRGISGMALPPISVKSYVMTAKIDLPDNFITGPIFAAGGQLGGTALYLRDGKPVFLLTTLKGEMTEVAADEALPAGSGTIELEVARAGGLPGAAVDWTVSIKSGGQTLARRTVNVAMPFSFGISETFGVGIDDGSPVLPGAASGKPFAGHLSDITFDFSAKQ